MWCEEDDLYYDLDQRGEFVKVKTAACFYPLMANIPDEKRAKILAKNLVDENMFWTKIPVATVSPSEKVFEKDMWCSPTWINCSYIVADGLRKYGFFDTAKELSKLVITEVDKWYQQIGVIMEYYDCEGIEDPRFMLRKQSYTKSTRVIRDFGWSAACYIAFANEL